MSDRSIPYTSDDLRYIADQIDKVLEVVGGELSDDDWRCGLTVDILDDMGYRVGQIRPYGDGWLGFYPSEVNG